MRQELLTSESVTEGHPDKICDQISDAVLDEVIRQDPVGRVACEAFVTVGLVIVGGEITTAGYVDLQSLVRNLLRDIGYTDSKYGLDCDTCAVLNAIGEQSPDIAKGVDTGGAGDQGVMVGYACRETSQLMPLPIQLAHALTRRLAQVRKEGTIPWLGPDGKSQVTVEYRDGRPVRVHTVVLACQHTEEVLDSTGERISGEAVEELIEKVAQYAIPQELRDDSTIYLINETGKFIIGGPQSDTGMTGRKIVADTYGGLVSHGGGAFSGKDPTKVDRSASYMARYVAKNIVKAELADKCEVRLAYAIGVPKPLSVGVNTCGTGQLPDERLTELVLEHCDLTPGGIIKTLDLLKPIFRKTACYGHFGREEEGFPWEEVDLAPTLKKAAG